MPPEEQSSSQNASAPILNYGSESRTPNPLMPGMLLLLGALPLVVVPFVSFCWEISPLFVVREFFVRVLAHNYSLDLILGLVAAPFFLGLVIPLWEFRRLMPLRVQYWEKAVIVMISGISALMTVGISVHMANDAVRHGISNDALLIFTGAAILMVGCAMHWRLRYTNHRDLSPTTFLLVSYLANAFMCLCIFRDPASIGWWLTLVGCVAPVGWLVWAMSRGRPQL